MFLKLRRPQILKKVIPKSNGIFAHMNYQFRTEVSKTSLDLMFLSNYGNRNPAPIIETLQDEYGSELTNEELTTLAAVIVEMYKEKWDKMGALYDIEYDPIHNYLDDWEDASENSGSVHREETKAEDITHGHSVSDSNTRTDNLLQTTDTSVERDIVRTDDLTEHNIGETENNGGVNQDNSVYGFNSATDNPRDKSVETHSDTDTNENTRTNTGTVITSDDQTVDETVANTGTRTDARTIINSGHDLKDGSNEADETSSGTRERSGKHTGNIGNITTQKQLREEIELWKWNYVQTILEDVKDFCTIPVYLKYPILYEEGEEE